MTKIPTLIRLIALLGAVAGFLCAASAQTAEQIIAKARAYLGDEAALNAVQSIHFRGTVETIQTTSQGPKQQKFGLEIRFQKPYQQRIVTTGPELTDTTSLNDYDGWHRLQIAGTAGRDQLDLLNPAQIKRLRANTWENLNFFKGIEQRGGRAEVIGPALVADQPALKVAFTHDAGIVFYHYFDPQTGRLLLTETDQGELIKEEGEVMVSGLRFAKKVIQTSKGRDAKGQPVEQTMTITYDQITCNEKFTDSDFELPILSLSRRTAAPATGK